MSACQIFTYFPWLDWLRTQQQHRNVTSWSENACSSSSDILMQLVCIRDWQQSQQMLACVSVQFWRHTRRGYASIRPLFWRCMTASFRMVPQCPEIMTFMHVTGLIAFILITLLVPSLLRGIICECSIDRCIWLEFVHECCSPQCQKSLQQVILVQ